jgi:hypothetical protein
MKQKSPKLLLLFLFLMVAVPAEGSEYYVSTVGSDQNAGNFSSPWGSIQYAVDRASPGDTIRVRGGSYNEAIVFSRSGSSAGYITLKNYGAETPVMDGTGINANNFEGLLKFEDIAYVKVVGFELRNLTTTNSGTTPAGIWVTGTSHHLEIRNNLIHSIKNTANNGNAHGIAVYGDNGESEDTSIHDIVIDGNEIRDCILGWSESLVLNGNVKNFVVSNNIIHDNNNIGIDFIGYEGVCGNTALDRARDGVCSGNTVFNIDTSTNPAYQGDTSGDGIYVDGGTRIVIERNIVHHCNIGIEIASEHSGKNSSYITVENNFVYQNLIMGIAMGGYDTKRGSTQHCKIVNNTCYHNDTAQDGNGELCLQYDTQYNEIKNNIFFSNAQNLFISNMFSANTGNTVDYNIYYGSGSANDPQWQWKDVVYNSFSSWQNATGNDQNGLFSDPRLENPESGDLHIRSDSPAIDRGVAVAGLVDDIDGDIRPMGNGVDMGADEAQTAMVLYVATIEGRGGHSPCYRSIGNALEAAGTGCVIKISSGLFEENFTLNKAADLTLDGGWGSSFETQTSNTTFIKSPRVLKGSLTFKMVTIKP